MPRVIGIDPGTVSIDVCGLDDGVLFVDRAMPTADALADPSALIGLLDAAGPLDLVAGPSGYGLPLTRARDLTDAELRLAYLAADNEDGGIGGLRSLMRALAACPLPVVLTPGVIHLPSVPAYRKVNRVDLGTADKVCAAALAIHDQARRRGWSERQTSFILLELGGAFTAAVAVEAGRIVDGVGGTSGPIGARASGALDGEVAFLAGTVSKRLLFAGGVATIGETPDAWKAFVEGAVKAAAALAVSVPAATEVIVSGRHASTAFVRDELANRLARVLPNAKMHLLEGFASVAKQGAQGAALVADGLAGGASAALVETMRLREASGTVLDHLHVITPAAARARLGIS